MPDVVDRPVAGAVEQRSAPPEAAAPTVDGRRLRGVIPYGVESRDLGGFREVMARGSLANADTSDLIATVDHGGVPLGRFPGTLEVEDRDDGMHWSLELPESRADIREAVERGDLRATSWRMIVGRDRWAGQTRHVEEVRALHDVSLVSTAAYRSAVAELRHNPEHIQEESTTMPTFTGTFEGTDDQNDAEREQATSAPETPPEQRSAPAGPGLQVEDRTAHRPSRGLTDRFRENGWPGERAVLPFSDVMESRALTVTGGPDRVSPVRTDGVPLGADRRWAWPVFPLVSVDAGVTSVDVLRQTARAVAAAGLTIRAIDATTPKPQTSSTVTVESAALKQVASVSTGIPNVYLESPAVNSIVEADLRQAIDSGLDKLVLDVLAGAGFQDPATIGLLTAIRKAITTIEGQGYAPNTLILTPAAAEQLDTLRATATDELYVFPPGEGAPGGIFGLTPRISTGAPAPIVVDSQAVGRLYAGGVALARFEEASGATNTSTVRLETNALFNVERLAAAVRIASA